MASILSISILPEGTELVYVDVFQEMPEGAGGSAVLVRYHAGTLAGCCAYVCAVPTLGPSTGANGVL